MTSARLLWLGQSGFLIELAGAHVLVDGFLSPHPDRQVASELPPGVASSLDVIACTHEHLDHLDQECVPKLAASSRNARVVVPEPIVDIVADLGIARDRVIGLRPGGIDSWVLCSTAEASRSTMPVTRSLMTGWPAACAS